MKNLIIITIVFTFILSIVSCHYPSTNQSQKKYKKENKELINKLNPDPLPKVFKENGTERLYLKTGWYFVTDSLQGIPREIVFNSTTELIYIDTLVQLTPKDIEFIYLTRDVKEKNIVNLVMYFDKAGTEKWSIITEKSISRKLAFVINNKIVMTPMINMQITSGLSVLWGNNYTPGEMLAIKKLLIKQRDG